jgi:hypothetical protein
MKLAFFVDWQVFLGATAENPHFVGTIPPQFGLFCFRLPPIGNTL